MILAQSMVGYLRCSRRYPYTGVCAGDVFNVAAEDSTGRIENAPASTVAFKDSVVVMFVVPSWKDVSVAGQAG